MTADQLFAFMRRHQVKHPCDRCGLWPIAAYRDHLERTVCVACVMTAVTVARVRSRRDAT